MSCLAKYCLTSYLRISASLTVFSFRIAPYSDWPLRPTWNYFVLLLTCPLFFFWSSKGTYDFNLPCLLPRAVAESRSLPSTYSSGSAKLDVWSPLPTFTSSSFSDCCLEDDFFWNSKKRPFCCGDYGKLLLSEERFDRMSS